jgi:GTPase SAR1 family protein
VEYATKIITTANNVRIKFQIWDTAGQEKYRYLTLYTVLS